jgi:hypothetical protein
LIKNILKHFVSFLRQRRKGIEVTQDRDDQVELRLNGKNYLIVLVNSEGSSPFNFRLSPREKLILLINSADWEPTGAIDDGLIFNFTSMKASYSRDKVHRELYDFMKMYYGVIFEYEQS